MNTKIENFDQVRDQLSSKNILPAQNDQPETKNQIEQIKMPSQTNIFNYQKALQQIMSCDNTRKNSSNKKMISKDGTLNFSSIVKNQNQVQESPANSIAAQHVLQPQSQVFKKGDNSIANRIPSLLQFEYVPRKQYQGVATQNNININDNQNNQRVVYVNFKMKHFSQDTLNMAISSLIYGTKATLCVPNKKYSNKVILVMSTTSADKLKVINPQRNEEKIIDITKISDIEFGIQNSSHANIRGLDPNRILSFFIHEREDIECLVQFETSQNRNLFLQGFQHFVQQSHKTQLTSGNIFKLRQQIELHIEEEQGKDEQTYDINEILDIFDQKVQLSISISFLRKIYMEVVKKDLDQQQADQKTTLINQQKAQSDDSVLLKTISNKQFLEIIDKILDRGELYSIFEKTSQVNDIKNKNQSENILTLDGFKSFVLYHQKEIISMAEIEQLFKKILNGETKMNQPAQVSLNDKKLEHRLTEQEVQQSEEGGPKEEKKESISFHGFVHYIYSKSNSIFNPKKEPLYQNMDRPINEYFINSAKNIFHAQFDIITMNKIAGFNFSNNEQYFPLLYALSRGARYIEIEVWDGETEPIILYGPIMNTKLNISDFLTQLVNQAFVINQYPLFLNIVPHCTVKQQFKLKYLIGKILKDNVYEMPQDYKERTNLPSPNDLKYKIVLIGKLPHTYDGLIQENYTQQDMIKFHQQSSRSQTPSPPLIVAPPNPNPSSNHTQDYVITGEEGGLTTIQPFGSILNQSYNQTAFQNILSNTFLYPQQSFLQPHSSIAQQSSNNFLSSQQQLQGQNLTTARSGQSNQIDGTLLTPVHVFSQNNLPGDSLDDEMNELILQEDMDENVNVFIAAGYISKDREQLDTNLQNGVLSSRNSDTLENILSTTRRGNSSSVKAIDGFFQKNLDGPKLKKFIQNKYEDAQIPQDQPSQRNIMKRIDEELPDNYDFKQEEIKEAKRGTFINLKYHPSEKVVNEGGKQNSFRDTSKSVIDGDRNQESISLQQNAPLAPRKKQESLNILFHHPLPSISHGINSSNPNITSAIFQTHRIRDYAPILASNTIESLYSLYITKIQRKKPALWEVYDFSQRDMNLYKENRLGYTVLSSYSSIDVFTKYYLAMTKPSCKPSDSININPVPFFNQGFQFILNYFHTFDRNSLIYQSRFCENGGQTCGYILKPFNLRNHVTTAVNANNRSRQKSMISQNNFQSHLYLNSRIEEQDEINYGDEDDNQEVRFMSREKSKRNFVQMQIISGYNLSTQFSDRVDSYVEILVFDGDSLTTYKTSCIDNNNMSPKWNYDIKFTVNNPSLCFIVFQVVNHHHSSLLGWYSIPFNCIRQGLRVVPLRDGFFNIIKNSYILCELSIVRESQVT